MAVGKGSLLRAASAAGKQSEKNLKLMREEEQSEVKKTETQRNETGRAKNTEAKSTEAKKAESKKAEAKKAESKKAEAKKAEAKSTEAKSTEAKNTEAKKAESKNEEAGKTEEKKTEVKNAEGRKTEAKGELTEPKKTEAKITRRKTGRKRSADVQSTYLLTIPTGQLREIPKEWRGPKYVRPNVSALAESVSRCGILEPLPVVQVEDHVYQLVGGSRRMQVVQMLGIAEVPVMVLPGKTIEDAGKLYQELALLANMSIRASGDSANQNVWNHGPLNHGPSDHAPDRTGSLFGKQRIPEYLL